MIRLDDSGDLNHATENMDKPGPEGHISNFKTAKSSCSIMVPIHGHRAFKMLRHQRVGRVGAVYIPGTGTKHLHETLRWSIEETSLKIRGLLDEY